MIAPPNTLRTDDQSLRTTSRQPRPSVRMCPLRQCGLFLDYEMSCGADVLMKRGLLASAAQRKPASPMSAATRDDVDHLLLRLAKFDIRAKL